MQEGYEGLDYTQYFLQIASEHQSKKNWASSWKGFNDVVASWAPPGGRHIQQLCGKTWIDSWEAVRDYTDRLDAVQVVTWHDYEEGTEIQSGIDNCLSVSASVNGNILSWSVPDESTLDHYTVYISGDGQNLMSLGDYYVGTNSLNLVSFNFAPRTYQVFVQAVGKPSVSNKMSPAAVYEVLWARRRIMRTSGEAELTLGKAGACGASGTSGLRHGAVQPERTRTPTG